MSLFPSSPIMGQTTTLNGNSYSYDSTKGWLKQASTTSSIINDSATSSTTNTYSIDKIKSLISSGTSFEVVSSLPSSPSSLKIYILNSNGTYTMNIYDTSWHTISGSSSGTSFTDWASSTNYTILTSFVLENNNLYRCITTHTSGTSFSDNSSYWTIIGHIHANKTYLDKIGEDSITGEMKYNGQSVINADVSNRSNGKVVTFNSTTGKNEYATVTVAGIVGSSTITTAGENITIASGSEQTFDHPTSTNIVVSIEEQISGSSVTDTHVDFSDSSKYTLQDSVNINTINNKLSLINGGIDVNTLLLLHFNGSVTDSSLIPNTVTNNGVTYNNTAQKFGTNCANFSGSSQYMYINSNSKFNFGTSDFTIDFWLKYGGTRITNYPTILNTSMTGWVAGVMSLMVDTTDASSKVSLACFSATGIATSSLIFNNTWMHVAFVMSNHTLSIYINGVLNTSVSNCTGNYNFDYSAGGLFMGRKPSESLYFNGQLDEFRISNIARWTSNFTPKNMEYYQYLNTTPLYAKTTGSSDYSLTTIDTITSLTIPVTLPSSNSTCKCLVSFDNGVNWLYRSSGVWYKYTGDLSISWTSSNINTDLQTYFTNISLITLTSDLSSLGIVPVALDFAFQLNTLSSNETPTIGAITMVYVNSSHNEFASYGSYSDSYSTYGIKRVSNSRLAVKNKSAVTKIIKVNMVTSV